MAWNALSWLLGYPEQPRQPWNPLNPIGTETTGGQYLTMPAASRPVVMLGGGLWGDQRPASQEQVDAFGRGSQEAFNQLSLVAGAPAAETGAVRSLGARRTLPNPPPTRSGNPLLPPEPESPSFTIYHGSPHDYAAERLVRMPGGETQYVVGRPNVLPDVPAGAEVIQDFPLGRMRMDKIGTGEGAQAYGHGLYGAEAEPVAQEYRDLLKWRGMNYDDPASIAASAMDRVGGDRTQAADNLQNAIDATVNFYRGNVPAAQAAAHANNAKAIELLRGGDPIIAKPPTPGSMYQVDINADPEHFLDWDKPLSQQSPKVQQFFKDRMGAEPPEGSVAAQMRATRMERPGGVAYQAEAGGDHAALSQALREAGIPGIKYLDAGSRGAGQGSSNYVLFHDSPDFINIIRKYGIAGLMAGGGAASLAGQGNDQQQ